MKRNGIAPLEPAAGPVAMSIDGAPADAAPDEKARKLAKRQRKLRDDQSRRLDGWEQYRALWDGIDFKRQLVNMHDKKVRFALVIMAALNAVLLLVLTRGPVLHSLPLAVRYTVAALLAVYAVVTFSFVTHSIEVLRPRPEARHEDNHEWTAREGRGTGFDGTSGHAGYFIRGSLRELSFEEERRLWNEARLSDVNAELTLFNRTASVILTHQLGRLQKVYSGLRVLAVLVALVLMLVVGTAVIRGGAEGEVTLNDIGAMFGVPR